MTLAQHRVILVLTSAGIFLSPAELGRILGATEVTGEV